ncbi:tRNA (adenosine(37)-N6)-threonylcarbamoyltransferase complex dimerization subunit type 1 TsaB [Shimia sp. SDUM112013]|uniref:tRNA (adenosine(37)-N6)-threonylcarbamoyltransferase complex dimerization subunit type 1 TsaB n=1 Tax=Shimia sp. SDUM112013 TaxID=3136160 RepID=UPI0032ECDE65
MNLTLAFDTSGRHCAAALLKDGVMIGGLSEDMARGQAERLMPLLQDVLSSAGYDWADLTAIGVGVGPGNFTGIRISVSAARGLALALGVPAVGVSTFEATSFDHPAPHVPTVAAPRDQVYAVLPGKAPALFETLSTDLPVIAPPSPMKLVENMARIAETRADKAPGRPAPLYIKAADAAPPRDPAPVILP